MSNLKEMSVNMPVIGINTSLETPQQQYDDSYDSYDVTAAVQVPPEVCIDKVDHIYITVESASVSSYDSNNPKVCIDLVLAVGINNPDTGASTSYKMIKRLKLDKAKLAYEAESLQPIEFFEHQDDAQEVAKIMEAFYQANRAREMAGLSEPAGAKAFKVMISFDDAQVGMHPAAPQRGTASLVIEDARSEAHARHIFDVKHSNKYTGVKITSVKEVI